MKQDSILSPQMFNKFINDLLVKLKTINAGVRIRDFHLNVFAYADDLNLVSTTAIGLQKLINICHQYAHMWRMRFNPSKTNIICIGKQPHIKPPIWTLGNTQICLSEDTNILGVTFNSKLTSTNHVKTRVRKCQQGMFKMASMGLSYPGLNSEVKAFLWNTIGSPILAYGMESMTLSQGDLKQLNSAQGTIIKRIMGVNNRAHHSNLQKALFVPTVVKVIENNSLRLYRNIFKSNTPARNLQSVLLAEYITKGVTTKGTLLDRVLKSGANPLKVIFDKEFSITSKSNLNREEDGLVDSLRFLLNHDNYNKPKSDEHILVTLLTKAF